MSGLGRDFRWLWFAYAASAYGTGLAFGALALVAILALDASPAQVSLLAAAGLAVGAVLAIPLGPRVEVRRKRPVMIAMDLVRFAALASVPVAYALDALTYAHLVAVAVAVVVGAAKIAFTAASGAYLKALVPPEHLLTANRRFEATLWSSIAVGPPLGGAAVGLFGPVTTVAIDAGSHVLSALGIRAIGGGEPRPTRTPTTMRATDLLAGWRFILGHPQLRPLFLNTIAVNGLIMATEPLIAVLMLDELGFPPWQYGLAFVGSGLAGLALVIVVELGLILCASIFSAVLATQRLQLTADDRVARTLSAWSVSSGATIAALTALWGVLAALTDPRAAIAAAGVLLLATPLLLPRRDAMSMCPVALERQGASAD